MSQQEIMIILEKNNDWLCTKELRKLVRNGKSSVQANIKRLEKQGLLLTKMIVREWHNGKIKHYKLKD